MTEILELLSKNKEITQNLRQTQSDWSRLSLQDVKDSEGFSLLHWAALRGYAELVLHLLQERHQDPNIKGPNDQTPIMWAAMSQELLTMHILIDYGAQLRAIDNIEDNAFLMSCQHDNFFGALWLLGRGADVNSSNIAGTSGAHWAAFSGSYLIICLLDAFGFDNVNNRDKNGLVPLHRALELEFWGTARMLITFDPMLLKCKTGAGQELVEFAKDRCLAQQTLESWLNLCRDANYKSPSESSAPIPTSVDLGEMNMKGLQKKLWQQLVAILDWLDRSPERRKFIPMLAYVFALVFVCTHEISLYSVNRSLGDFLGFTFIERMILRNIFYWIPYLGLIAVISFSLLLILDPGFYDQNFVSKINETEETNASLLTTVNLSNVEETKRKTDLLRRRRRSMFEDLLKYLNTPESLLLFTKNRVDGEKDVLVRNYLKSKGIDLMKILKSLDSSTTSTSTCSVREICNKLDLGRICPTCWRRRGLRTKHCSTCDRCCELLDHHCAWINCCVGKNSHACFALFIFTGYISQCHQIFLIALFTASIFFKHGFKALGSWTTYQILALPFLASCLHFITISWSSQLFRAQWKNMTQGYTVSESLNEYRYNHFIVSADCDENGLPKVPSSIPTIYPTHSLAECSAPLIKPKVGGKSVKKKGVELVEEIAIEALEANTKEAIIASVVKKEPEIKDDINNEQKDVLIKRRFVRNPFVSGQSTLRNCIQFWTNSRPVDIDFEKLDDTNFVQTMAEEISQRRRKGATSSSPSFY